MHFWNRFIRRYSTQEKPETYRTPSNVIAIWALVISTGINGILAYYTYQLFQQTKISTDAAQASAESARSATRWSSRSPPRHPAARAAARRPAACATSPPRPPPTRVR